MVLKIFTKTFGCLINEYDTYRIIELLQRVFFLEVTDEKKNANILLLNSCAVRYKVEKKIISELIEWFEFKKNKNIVIILVGCFTSIEYSVQKHVDLVINNNEIDKIPEYLLSKSLYFSEFYKKQSIFKSSSKKLSTEFFPIIKSTGSAVCVPIADGCNNFCTYCAVPSIRGVEVNRSVQSILNDIKYYVTQGVKEITLLGQNVNAYKYKTTTIFSDLINEITTINGIERIRFLTAHPNYLTDDLIKCYASVKLVNHLHLPLQSGSNNILKKMKRGYTYEEYKEKVMKLKEIRPNIVLTTDIIVGFPGETYLDFKKTVLSVKEIGFDFSYCFIYSKRPKTLAYSYEDDVELQVKKERLNCIQRIFLSNGIAITNKFINTIHNVLFFGSLGINLYWGKTEHNRTVLLSSCENVVGMFLKIKLIRSVHNTYIGVKI